MKATKNYLEDLLVANPMCFSGADRLTDKNRLDQSEVESCFCGMTSGVSMLPPLRNVKNVSG